MDSTPRVIGPVPHVIRSGDELRFTVRTFEFHEGNWPALTLPVRYKGERADHIYGRITDPTRAAVDVYGILKAQPDGSLHVQARSIVGARVLVLGGGLSDE
jgi:hypothetical protein